MEEQRSRLRRNMVINPIYDQNEVEHQYEHIPALRYFQPNTFFLEQTDNCTVASTACVLDNNHTNEENDTNTTRYVDTPVHSENINQTLSLESNEKYVLHHNDADDGISNPRPVYVETDDEQCTVSRLSLEPDAGNDGAESAMAEDELKSEIDDLLMALDSELSDGDKSYGVLTLVDPREC